MSVETKISDREIIAALQGGLPIVAAPFAKVADKLGMSEADLVARIAAMKDSGAIRRIAAAPNHYKLGMVANGMTVWDVEDAQVAELGAKIGALPFVTHCYERPRAREQGWPYNLFAMVHGDTPAEVEAKRAEIAALLGDACQGHDILYSKRILKKTGLRLRKRG
ncbi:siroheme decarboxylase subunit beta [Parasedimentitalea maritima]|uniref:siroheme decarboxylase n=1 Tax=Parasedimentitalea maritima TaxID=2578117 RepID=A0A6A4RAQ8_9RHOB|nr:Lrp/AsnC family transcriptional regulator [Zongyanglinia marina]KAE9627231.1 Lrp/AsnC family transcriptional regulator [Zongyanglinia marina]